MSFFGGGGAAAKSKSYTITSADLLNAIVISEFITPFGSYYLERDALYDGTFEIQSLAQDGTWQTVDTRPNANDNKANQLLYTALNQPNGSNTANQYPNHFRAIITLKATQGTCKVKVDYV